MKLNLIIDAIPLFQVALDGIVHQASKRAWISLDMAPFCKQKQNILQKTVIIMIKRAGQPALLKDTFEHSKSYKYLEKDRSANSWKGVSLGIYSTTIYMSNLPFVWVSMSALVWVFSVDLESESSEIFGPDL